MRILLANPRGFCAGVNMAIDCLEECLRAFGPEIYVYHEIVHNRQVVNRFSALGVKFVEDIAEVPAGSILVYSAHGVSPAIREEARARSLRAIDATCPLVTKVHIEAVKFANAGYNIILIGHEGHDEVIGTMGEAPESITLIETPEDVDKLHFGPSDKLAYLTQTTLSVEEARQVIDRLVERFPHVESPPKEDICYATTNRQNSSNSRRLMEIGRTEGKPAYLIDGRHELRDDWFSGIKTVLVTAGASAPEVVVQECLSYLSDRFDATVEEVTTREEHVTFPLPRELRQLQMR
jgi:4-hydroxy-3-methylbut-2-enyl diphosphate reductase